MINYLLVLALSIPLNCNLIIVPCKVFLPIEEEVTLEIKMVFIIAFKKDVQVVFTHPFNFQNTFKKSFELDIAIFLSSYHSNFIDIIHRFSSKNAITIIIATKEEMAKEDAR